jgi:UDP-N-acetylglucosamine 2-epimerase (non-hydrolysing)
MKLLFFFGTRPEAIKLSPLVKELRKYGELFNVKVCVSAQHREMLDQVLEFFDIKPDFDLDIMKPDQDIYDILTKSITGIRKLIKSCRPDYLIIQGDTTTTFAGALAAYYEKVKVAHVEAGLRSFDKYAPFPEEMNRLLTSHIADLHFAPTPRAKENLMKESIPDDKICVVGNTGIDALFTCLDKLADEEPPGIASFRHIDFKKKVILVTGHRRESFGKPFENICEALKSIASNNTVEIVYPVHLNPNVRKPVFKILGDLPNIHLVDPIDYPTFVWLMNKAYLIITDSGGIQEEVPSLGKPVLVMRDVTERMEGVEAGTARLVGTNKDVIVREAMNLLENREEYEKMSQAINPYGDGTACIKIRQVFAKHIIDNLNNNKANNNKSKNKANDKGNHKT